ncbi:MAG: hypothetical protein ACYCZT_14430, partial [Thiobacillus sp.]
LKAAVRYGLPLLPLAILFLPATRQRGASSTLDFIFGLMLSLLIMVVALGAFAVVAVAQVSYAWALVQTLLGMAALLLALSWLWNPRAGFGGLGQITSRYLLSVGLPFEGWAQRLATLAERERDPESFVRDALSDLHELTWIRGGHWRAARGEGMFGEPAEHAVIHAFHGLTLTWQSPRPLTPALALHVRLLSQLLGYFYAAKVREQPGDSRYRRAPDARREEHPAVDENPACRGRHVHPRGQRAPARVDETPAAAVGGAPVANRRQAQAAGRNGCRAYSRASVVGGPADAL